MRDVVFLFGAGASYGAGGIIPERPPLGAHLYETLARFFPNSWGALPAELRTAFEANVGNFEVGMEAIYQRAGAAIPMLMRDMALYFVQFRVVGETCHYLKLARELVRLGLLHRCVFATLNYECTLEHAFTIAGVTIDYFESSTPHLPVWKLHGSCNFFNSNINAGPGIGYGVGVNFEGGIKAFGSIDETVDQCLNRTSLAPVMSLYMKGKPLAISPSAIRHIQGLWGHAANEASAVFTIGVNPNPADEHVWSPIGATTGMHYFVGQKNAFEVWQKNNRIRRSEFLGDRFADTFPSIVSSLQNLCSLPHKTNKA